MTNFRIIFRTESSGEYSGFSINEYIPNPCDDVEQVISDFLTPTNFKHEDFHIIKRLEKYKDDGFLGHALNLEKVKLDDFRKLGKLKTITLLDNEIPKKSEADTISSDRYVLEKIISIIQSTDADEFYFISRDFFDTNLKPFDYDDGKHKLLYDAIIYNPYILIIWFTKDKILHVCEYSSD